jgi:glutamate-1-semialdehyde 2,1-aminomutase
LNGGTFGRNVRVNEPIATPPRRHNSMAASAALYERALAIMPGGSTRATLYSPPFPPYATRGQGSRVFDEDGQEYLDLVNNFFSQVHGHAHPEIVAAVQSQAALGLSFALPTASEVVLAEEICARSEVLENIRFCNSGTEAVMIAIKAARAFTGRARIAKFEGAYHGAYDHVEVSLDSNPSNWGSATAPASIAYAAGTPPRVLEETVVLPFDDPAACEALIDGHAADLACVLMDPMPSSVGMIEAPPDLLRLLRDATARHGVVLICDEIVNFRLGWGGAHSRYNFTPDLVTLGKVIGGGQPIGAIAGRRELMAVFDVRQGRPRLSHGGTFTANPLTMAAGLASMRLLTQDALARLNAMGARLRHGLAAQFARSGVPMQVTGAGSLFRVHPIDRPVTGYRSAYTTAAEKARLNALRQHLQAHGVLVTKNISGALSTVMTDADIDLVLQVFAAGLDSVAELRGG